MEYDYEVIDGSGRTVTGQLEAESPAEVVRALSRDGHTVVDVSERRPSALPTFQRRLRASELVVAFHELATLLESGVALGDAILAQSRGTHHPVLAQAFTGIGRDLMRGLSFLDAVRASDLPLPDYVYQLVEAGEISGRLPQSLREAVDQLEYDQRVVTDIRSALVYPAILVMSGIAVVLLVFIVVVPEFANLLDEADDLHILSVAVLRSGVWFNDNTWLLAAIIATVVVLTVGLAAPGNGSPAARGRGRQVAGGRRLVYRNRYREVGVRHVRHAGRPRGIDGRARAGVPGRAHQPPQGHAPGRDGGRQRRQRAVGGAREAIGAHAHRLQPDPRRRAIRPASADDARAGYAV